MCNALGSILGKICDQCTTRCNCGNICDCSQTTIVVGSIDQARFQGHVQGILEGGGDLQAATKALDGESIENKRVRVLTGDDVEAVGEGARMGLLEFTRHWACVLGGGQTEEAREEGLNRLTTSALLCGVDLQDKYQRGDPLDMGGS